MRSNPHPPASKPPPRQPKPWPAYEPAAIHKLPRDVIAKIFSHLSVADRCSVSLVCRLWFRYERLLPHYMQSEVSATEIRFVLRGFPLIRTLRVRCLGPTVLPGAPREQRADDRHHKRPGGGGNGGMSAGAGGGGTGIGGGGAQVGGSGTEAGGGEARVAAVGGGEARNGSPHAAAAAATPQSPISDADVLDGSAIVRLLSLNTPLQIQQVAGTQIEYLSICNCGEYEVHQVLRDYLTHTIATWGCSIRHIEMHDPLPLADEFWKCVEGHPMLSKVTVYKCTHLTDRFLRHVARCGALKEISIASCPNVSGGGFAELAEKCPGLEGMHLEDLSLSVVAKKARSAPGAGRAGGGGAGEGERAEGRVGLDGRAAKGETERIGGGEGERGVGGAGEDVRMGERGGADSMEGRKGRDGDRAQEWGIGRADEANGAARESGEAEAAAEALAGGEGTVAARWGGNLAASFPNLSSLKIINCALDAHWLEMFAGQLPALRRLTVMACPDPLDRFFLTAARTAARLESVEIVDCEGVSDRGIVALLKGCPTITSLTLSGCESGGGDGGEGGGAGRGGGGGDRAGGNRVARVTDESLRAVVVHGVGLRSLQLKWSPGFSGQQLARDVLDARRWCTTFETNSVEDTAVEANSFEANSFEANSFEATAFEANAFGATQEAALARDGLTRGGLPRDGLPRDGLTRDDVSGTQGMWLSSTALPAASDSPLLLLDQWLPAHDEQSRRLQSQSVQPQRLQSHVLPLLQLGWSALESLHLEGLDGLSDSFLLLPPAPASPQSPWSIAGRYQRQGLSP
ncbi:unnamed protein product [Closterium sp. Yama58-4]|nr:unnamed protein product [Closterium sp. Yama58-4]